MIDEASDATVQCSCGRTVDLSTAPYVGTMTIGVDRLALYNCECRSTVSYPAKDAPSSCSCCGLPINGVKTCTADLVLCLSCARRTLGREAFLVPPASMRHRLGGLWRAAIGPLVA